jgi:hypothetical protein
MSNPGPGPGTIQQAELQGEINVLTVGNQLMLSIKRNWIPPGPTNIPSTVQQLNAIIALSNSIEQIAVALLGTTGTGGSAGP